MFTIVTNPYQLFVLFLFENISFSFFSFNNSKIDFLVFVIFWPTRKSSVNILGVSLIKHHTQFFVVATTCGSISRPQAVRFSNKYSQSIMKFEHHNSEKEERKKWLQWSVYKRLNQLSYIDIFANISLFLLCLDHLMPGNGRSCIIAIFYIRVLFSFFNRY